jgi:IMP dehydrogenase/GMP reductase
VEKFDLNDILICPSGLTSIRSRSEVNHLYGTHLPIIAAPMDTVVGKNNISNLVNSKINFCLPRGMDMPKHNSSHGLVMDFKSFGLEEFRIFFLTDYETSELKSIPYKYLLIDIANGHMEDLQKIVSMFKAKYKDTYKLMVGNVANPETYKIMAKAGADFIRVGIGNGNGCLTTQQTGVGYPMGSLIQECYNIKNEMSKARQNVAKIVADGGMKTYSDIIKSLALGADYVMVGSILNKALDSAGPTTLFGIKLDQHSNRTKRFYELGLPLKKKFRGMSTKEVQKAWGRQVLKTSEGVIRKYDVEYTLKSWSENFEHYLKSAMSYSDAKELVDFTGLANTIHITNSAYKRFNK